MIKFQNIDLGFQLKYRKLKQQKECNYYLDMFFQNRHLTIHHFGIDNFNKNYGLNIPRKQSKENISILVGNCIGIIGKLLI